eukprot:SAG31_NODE_16942_length_689_cov_1.645763_2_plen_45_part_01
MASSKASEHLSIQNQQRRLTEHLVRGRTVIRNADGRTQEKTYEIE